MLNKKGVSPVIATVLLILIVIVLATIILLWARSFRTEQVIKFGEPVETSCSRVQFQVQETQNADSLDLSLVNTGDIPIYKFAIKKISSGKSEFIYEHVNVLESKGSLLQGQSGKIESISIESNIKEIQVFPMLLGKNEKGKKREFICPKEYSVTIKLN